MGPRFSRTYNDFENIVSSQVTTTMKSEIDASVNLSCSNVQQVINSKGCNVTFAEQACKAYGFSDVAVSSNLDSTVTQAIIQDIKQQAESKTSGINLGLANISNTSNVVKNYTKLGIETLQSFKTDCSKNISSLNIQSVENTSCTEQNEINFAAQTISADVIGNCVATQVGKSSAAQELQQYLDQTATATDDGVSLMGLFSFGFIILAFVLGIPLGLKILITRSKNKSPPESRAAAFLSVVLVVLLVFWFPGLGAYFLGIGFWPYPGDKNEDALCKRGQPVDPEKVVNTFMWYDGFCASREDKDEPCTSERKMVHYKTCGVFSGICNDPQLAVDKTDFVARSEKCAAVDAIRPSSMAYCVSGDIASGIFSNYD